jgi:hypothetical protein
MDRSRFPDQVGVVASLCCVKTPNPVGPTSDSRRVPDTVIYSRFGGLSSNPPLGPDQVCFEMTFVTIAAVCALRLHFAGGIGMFFAL